MMRVGWVTHARYSAWFVGWVIILGALGYVFYYLGWLLDDVSNGTLVCVILSWVVVG